MASQLQMWESQKNFDDHYSFSQISQFILVSALFVAKIKAPINGLPQDGRGGNPQEIWHFQDLKCQFSHPWVPVMSQIPTHGAN